MIVLYVLDQATCDAILKLPMVACRQIDDTALRFVRNITRLKDRHILDVFVPIDKLIDNICKCHNSTQKYKIAAFIMPKSAPI